jgi:chorismate dehydratase
MKTSNKKISIGLINFTNCLPINYALEKTSEGQLLFSRGYPALINQLMHAGQVHVAPMSSIEFLQNQKDYVLIKNACITSDAECGSVILFSNFKFEDLEGKNIAIPNDSATSIAMLKVLLKEKGVDLKSINFSIHKYEFKIQEALKKYDAVLQIGDAALVSRYNSENNTDFYQYDLGRVWKEITGFAPVFGTWAARADWANANKDSFEELNLLITKAVEAGLGVYFNEVVQIAAENLDLPQEYIKDYLTAKIKYKFGVEQEKSLLLFNRLYERLKTDD